MVTDIDQLDFSKYYTYADYLTWRFSERVELLRGKIVRVAPAPNTKHQRTTGRIFVAVSATLQNQRCEAFIAPFDVRLPVRNDRGKEDTVVQPDITVVCNPDLLTEQGCDGAPDLVVEVLSPGNTKREMNDKFTLYEEAGVQEYWLVHPQDETVIIYSLNEQGTYIGSPFYTNTATVESIVLPGFKLDLTEIF